MNLFLRLLIIFIRARVAAGSTHYTDKHHLRFRVLLTDQDMFNHMNNSRYYSITDLASIDWFIRTGIWKHIRPKGWFPVYVYKEIFHHKEMRFPQRYEVTTQLAGWEGPHVAIVHKFMLGDTCVATTHTIGRMIGPKGQRPLAEDVISLMGYTDIKRPELPVFFQDRLAMVNDLKPQKATQA